MATEPEDVISTLAPMLREPLARDARTVEEPAAAGSDGRPTAQVPEVGAQDRARLLAALGPAPVDIDELARATGLPARALQIALIELALAGRIERHGHQLISLAQERRGQTPFDPSGGQTPFDDR
jgi:DNA processing protein